MLSPAPGFDDGRRDFQSSPPLLSIPANSTSTSDLTVKCSNEGVEHFSNSSEEGLLHTCHRDSPVRSRLHHHRMQDVGGNKRGHPIHNNQITMDDSLFPFHLQCVAQRINRAPKHLRCCRWRLRMSGSNPAFGAKGIPNI